MNYNFNKQALFCNLLFLIYDIIIPKTIAIIGGGVMGNTLAHVITKADTSYRVLVCDRDIEKLKKLADNNPEIKITTDVSQCISASIVFLAVKPQDFANISITFDKQTLLCSIMAGVSIKSLRRLGTNNIVRIMPNTPAQVGVGFTAWTATDSVTQEHKKLLAKILSRMGKHIYVEQEDDINKATAISGSGPAYFFLMTSLLAKSARELGFSEKLASQMAVQTMKGASTLLNDDSDLDLLIQRVTSKGGTTEAAIKVFENSDIAQIWQDAIRSAYERAEKLSG